MPPPSDLTRRHPHMAQLLAFVQSLPGILGRKSSLPGAGVGTAGIGVGVNAGGQKGFAFSQPYPRERCVDLWQLLPHLPL